MVNLSHKKGFGKHILLDLNDCNEEKLSSFDLCFDFLNHLPNHISMTKITQPYVFPYSGKVPEDKGITGMVIIAESHISIHTFPLKKYAFIDIFSCMPFNTEIAIDYCVKTFKSNDPISKIIDRGETFRRSERIKLPAQVSI